MIRDKNNRWHYLAVKNLKALFRETTSNHHRDFYCLNCFHSYSTFNKLKNMKEYVIIMNAVAQTCLKKMKK